MEIIAIHNNKGGVGKSITALSLAAGLAKSDKQVLLIDLDPQASLTSSLSASQDVTIATLMQNIIDNKKFKFSEGIVEYTDEGIDFIASSIELSSIEIALLDETKPSQVLLQYIKKISKNYDYIIIDTSPALNLLTINALTASTKVIITVQADFLAIKGMQYVLSTIEQINSNRKNVDKLEIAGVLFTMINLRTNFSKQIIESVSNNYNEKINIFETKIPISVKVGESLAHGKSIYSLAPKSNVALAYEKFSEEVLAL